jgi:hypothetical protein
VPIIIDENPATPERRPRTPAAPAPDRASTEAAAERALDLIALARERDARLAPP